MKCVIDPDLLLPPPVPGTSHFKAMVLHSQELDRLALKVSISFPLMGILWEHWRQVENRQHKEFLLRILTRHLAQDFPKDIEIQSDLVKLIPNFLNNLDEHFTTEWLRSLIACYDTHFDFNTDGAVLATWDRKELKKYQTVQLKYQQIEAVIPIKRDQEEWNLLKEAFTQSPIPHNKALRIYADESGNDGSPEWIALVVIKESDANEISRTTINNFNERLRTEGYPLEDIHIRRLRTEREKLFIVNRIVRGLSATEVVCFIVHRKSEESENDLYARGIRETLRLWGDLIYPIYIDTPYDREGNDRSNLDLINCIHNATQELGENYRSDDIILGKSCHYPGLGIADAIAYLYYRKSDPEWRDIWCKIQDKRNLL